MNTTELRKASMAIFLGADETVARDISDKLRWAADKIEQLTSTGIINLDRVAELINKLTTLERKVSELEQKLSILHIT